MISEALSGEIALQGVELAKHFEQLVRADTLFEVPAERFLGMVVFKLKVRASTLTLHILIGSEMVHNLCAVCYNVDVRAVTNTGQMQV